MKRFDISVDRFIINDIHQSDLATTSLRGADEIIINNPSRSAKLRFVTRNKNDFNEPNSFKEKFKKYLDLENRHV